MSSHAATPAASAVKPVVVVVDTFGGPIRHHNPELPLIYWDDAAVTRGDGVFETLLIRDGRACNLERHSKRFAASAISMDGMRSDHTDAAIITPAANPISARRTPSCISRFIKNTHAAPSVVPINGIINPQKTVVILFPYAYYSAVLTKNQVSHSIHPIIS